MEAITIPKKLSKKGDLVVLPRKEYEELLKRKEFYDELDKDLDMAVRDYEAGNVYGPFDTVEEGKKFLQSRKKKK